MAQEREEEPQEEGAGEPARRRGRGRYGRRRKVCMFCVEHVKVIDYKDVSRLRRFLSDRGRIEPRRKLGTCAKHQRALSQALKRARHLALLPYTAEHIRATGSFSSRQ
jgi:small subunit ribosomal protein S18